MKEKNTKQRKKEKSKKQTNKNKKVRKKEHTRGKIEESFFFLSFFRKPCIHTQVNSVLFDDKIIHLMK